MSQEALSVSPDVPVIECDARQRKSAKTTLMTLVQHAMGAREWGRVMMAPWRCAPRSPRCSRSGTRSRWRRWAGRPAARWRRRSPTAAGWGCSAAAAGDRAWLDRELPIVAERTSQPWGVGFQSWAVDVGTVERALAYRPRAVMLSFGDPRPFAGPSAGRARR